MNALSFGLVEAAYRNVSADGVQQPLDWVVGIATLLLVDQKMMGLFSLLFGVGVVIFADRARVKGRRVVWLSLWRFLLLFGIAIAHNLLWEGDVLIIYATCAPLLLVLSRLPARVNLGFGVVIALSGSIIGLLVQQSPGFSADDLGSLWVADGGLPSDAVGLWFLGDFWARALGLMLIGIGLFRLGIVQGERDEDYYRRMAWWGLGIGGVVTAIGMVLRVANDWAPEQAIAGHVPTGLGTIPMTLGYMALIILWNRGLLWSARSGRYRERFRNVGRMALTNYLTQTIIGVVMLTWWWGDFDLSRTMIAVWIVAVWALQLWWSTWWLGRFRFGPFEWLWRCATYRTWEPLRRADPAPTGQPRPA